MLPTKEYRCQLLLWLLKQLIAPGSTAKVNFLPSALTLNWEDLKFSLSPYRLIPKERENNWKELGLNPGY